MSSGRSPALRRARALVAYWDDSQYVIENFLEQTAAVASPAVALLLTQLSEYTSTALVRKWLTNVEGGHALLDQLLERKLLIARGTSADRRDRAVDAWDWPQSARWFHFATTRVEFEADPEVQRRSLVSRARHTPPPAPYLRRGAGDLQLPSTVHRERGDVWRTLGRRRSVRQFRRSPIDLETFTMVLRWTWGAVHHEVGQLGPFVLKTSPSGGGRHPIEVYPLVLRVDGLSPGIYHYRVETDTLGLLSSDVDDALAARLVASQDWISDAAVVFLMTAVLERSMWKYKHAHAFRVVLMDAGHLGQTFHLVCTALGLAPFTSAANDAAAVENLLGIDGIDEVVVYTAATGWPVRSAHHRAGRS